MRAGRGTRAAAVMMAGLVGAAVFAPGVAFAQPVTPAPTCTSTEKLNEALECVPLDDTAGSVGDSGSVVETPSTTAEIPSTGTTPPETPAAGDSSTPTTPASPSTPSEATTTDQSEETEGTDAADAAEQVAAAALPAPKVSPAQATAALQNLTGTGLTSALPIADVLQDLPTGNLDLGDIEIPKFPSTGSFTSPRDACLFLASKVTVEDSLAGALGDQFASFCDALPGSFDPDTGYGSLPDLVVVLDRLCHGLKDTHHHGHHPYGRDDINCDDVTADEAQAIYEADRSDPNNLDGDNDGRACEWNPDDYETVTVHYDGYPQGGVATGDSVPTQAPAGAASGLALAGLAGATRRREDRDDLENEVAV